MFVLKIYMLFHCDAVKKTRINYFEYDERKEIKCI